MSEANESGRAALGARLAKIRDYQGFTQEDVSKALKIPRAAVSEIETGRRKVGALELAALARIYSLPVAYLLDEPACGPPGTSALISAAAGLDDDDKAELMRFAEYLHFRRVHRAAQL
jgi:transcriptional regulator with XRE-family HTH domain